MSKKQTKLYIILAPLVFIALVLFAIPLILGSEPNKINIWQVVILYMVCVGLGFLATKIEMKKKS